MLLLEKLFGGRRNAPFEEIIGHDHIKKLFQMATTSNEPTHILLTGPPASAMCYSVTRMFLPKRSSRGKGLLTVYHAKIDRRSSKC